MNALLVLLIIIFNIIVMVSFFQKSKNQNIWLLPVTYFLLSGFLQYPLRAFVLIMFEEQNLYRLSQQEILVALIYYTIFILILLLICQPRQKIFSEQQKSKNSIAINPSIVGLGICFLMIVISFCFRATGGMLYALYDDISQLYFSSKDNLLASWWALRWLFLPWALVEYKYKRKGIIGVMIALILLLSMVDTIVSTGKGIFLYFLVLYLSYKDQINEKISKQFVSGLVSVAIIFSIYSYIARFYGNVRGQATVQSVGETLGNVQDNASAGAGMALSSIATRFSYLDGLALTIRRHSVIDKGPYKYGSLVEIGTLLPRVVWPSRPFLSFNHYITYAVWESAVFSEVPIGRIGESFFVGGWFGLVYAIMYGFIFRCAISLYSGLGNYYGSMGFGIYVFILIGYFVPDAYLFYGVKNLVYLIPWIIVIHVLGKSKKRQN